VVAHLLSLKLRLLRNGLRRSPWQVVALVIGLLYGLGIAALAVAGLVALRAASAETAATAVGLGGALLVLGWALVPLVAFGTDATLDPSRLVLLPLTARQLVGGLLLVGLVSVPGLVTALAALATVVTWSRGPLVVAVALAGALLGLATCVALSRATTTAAAGLLHGRRTREVGAGIGALVVSGLGLVPLALQSTGGLDADRVRRIAGVLGWTPLGWAWTAPAEVALGRPGAGLAKLVLAALALVVVLALWAAALERALVTPPSAGGGRRATVGSASGPASRALARLERTPTGAVTARALRYWRRDPRYLTALVALIAIPLLVVFLGATSVLPAGAAALAAAPVLGWALGWTGHNDVAYDGSAVWLHVASGLPGRADRLGRAAALLVWAVPLVLVAAVVAAALSGTWGLLPATTGAALALLGSGVGVSAVASALTPYPVPEPGANPFATPRGAAIASLVAQLATTVVTGLVASPALALLVAAAITDRPGLAAALAWAALATGLVCGAGAAVLGVVSGGRLFERRGPQLIAVASR